MTLGPFVGLRYLLQLVVATNSSLGTKGCTFFDWVAFHQSLVKVHVAPRFSELQKYTVLRTVTSGLIVRTISRFHMSSSESRDQWPPLRKCPISCLQKRMLEVDEALQMRSTVCTNLFSDDTILDVLQVLIQDRFYLQTFFFCVIVQSKTNTIWTDVRLLRWHDENWERRMKNARSL